MEKNKAEVRPATWYRHRADACMERNFDPDGDVRLVLTNTDNSRPNLEFIVSSRHMILASPVFKAMLSGNFKEGHSLQAEGSLQISVPDDDPAALSILLNAIHGHSRKVPRHLDHELMTSVSLLVDKYRLHAVMEVYSEQWVELWWHRYASITSVKQPEFLSSLCILWVSSNKSMFRRLITAAIKTSTKKIDGIDFPVPDYVYDFIDNRRIDIIKTGLNDIEVLLTKFQGGDGLCKRTDGKNINCDDLLLGRLVRSLSKAGLYPLPKPPYTGLSVQDLQMKIKGLKVQSLCDILPRGFSFQERSTHSSGLFSPPNESQLIFQTIMRYNVNVLTPLQQTLTRPRCPHKALSDTESTARISPPHCCLDIDSFFERILQSIDIIWVSQEELPWEV